MIKSILVLGLLLIMNSFPIILYSQIWSLGRHHHLDFEGSKEFKSDIIIKRNKKITTIWLNDSIPYSKVIAINGKIKKRILYHSNGKKYYKEKYKHGKKIPCYKDNEGNLGGYCMMYWGDSNIVDTVKNTYYKKFILKSKTWSNNGSIQTKYKYALRNMFGYREKIIQWKNGKRWRKKVNNNLKTRKKIY